MSLPERAVRTAKADDLSVILAFDHESTKKKRREFIQRAIDCGNAYVVEQDGSVIAVGILEYTFFDHGFISLVYVEPRERRSGVGEMLLRYFVSACRTSKLFSQLT